MAEETPTTPEPITPATQELPIPELPTEGIRVEDIKGMLPAISNVPTHNPRNFYEQIIPYQSGTNYGMYTYIKDTWKKIYDSSVGSQGPQGSQGFQGPQGTQGFQGNQGSQGSQGFQGNQGSQGFQGPQGSASGGIIGITRTASDNLHTSADNSEAVSSAGAYGKYKEIKIISGGIMRIKFDLGNNSGGTFGRIYRNGVGVGTEQYTEDLGWINFSEDISGWSVGDLCQLYCKTLYAGNYCRNFRLYFDISNDDIINDA
jgi:hypothetical protein